MESDDDYEEPPARRRRPATAGGSSAAADERRPHKRPKPSPATTHGSRRGGASSAPPRSHSYPAARVPAQAAFVWDERASRLFDEAAGRYGDDAPRIAAFMVKAGVGFPTPARYRQAGVAQVARQLEQRAAAPAREAAKRAAAARKGQLAAAAEAAKTATAVEEAAVGPMLAEWPAGSKLEAHPQLEERLAQLQAHRMPARPPFFARALLQQLRSSAASRRRHESTPLHWEHQAVVTAVGLLRESARGPSSLVAPVAAALGLSVGTLTYWVSSHGCNAAWCAKVGVRGRGAAGRASACGARGLPGALAPAGARPVTKNRHLGMHNRLL